MSRSKFVFVSFLLLLLSITPAHADNGIVNTNNSAALETAIDDINTNSGGTLTFNVGVDGGTQNIAYSNANPTRIDQDITSWFFNEGKVAILVSNTTGVAQGLTFGGGLVLTGALPSDLFIEAGTGTSTFSAYGIYSASGLTMSDFEATIEAYGQDAEGIHTGGTGNLHITGNLGGNISAEEYPGNGGETATGISAGGHLTVDGITTSTITATNSGVATTDEAIGICRCGGHVHGRIQ